MSEWVSPRPMLRGFGPHEAPPRRKEGNKNLLSTFSILHTANTHTHKWCAYYTCTSQSLSLFTTTTKTDIYLFYAKKSMLAFNSVLDCCDWYKNVQKCLFEICQEAMNGFVFLLFQTIPLVLPCYGHRDGQIHVSKSNGDRQCHVPEKHELHFEGSREIPWPCNGFQLERQLL